MKKLKRLVWLTLILNVIYLSSYGQNMGSEISWSCLGGDSFLIKMIVYNDCNSGPMVLITINFYCATTGTLISSMNLNAPSWVDATPICRNSCTRCQSTSCSFPYGIRKYIYQRIVHLSSAGSCCSIRISNSFGSRSGSITTGAAYQGFYTEAQMNRCQSPCDNSPEFTNIPVSIACVGADLGLNNQVTDTDKDSNGKLIDSITYQWIEPLSYRNTPIPYLGSYSYDKPVYFWGFPNDALPLPRGIHLDPLTGLMTFRPMKAEVTVMAVKVKEFRNGTLIAEIRREMEVIIITCATATRPSIRTPGNIQSKSVCVDDTVLFNFSTTDQDTNDTVTISYNNAVPGAVWTDSNGLSLNPGGLLTWVPTNGNVSSLPYTFNVTATDNLCPINSTYTHAYQITVKPKPQASLTVIDSGCGKYWFHAQPISGAGPVYMWQGQSLNFVPNTGPVVFNKLNFGTHPYSMTMTDGGCSMTYYDTIIVADTFISNTLGPDTIVCYGSTISLKTSVIYNSGPVKMIWGSGKKVFNSDTGLSKILIITRDTVIWSRASDTTVCKSIDTIRISIHKPIGLDVGPDIRICSYGLAFFIASYQINDGAKRSITWTDLKTHTVVSHNISIATSDSVWYLCTVADTFGCTGYDTIRVIKNPEIIASVIGQIICFGDEAELIADSTGGGNAQYLWYDGTNLIGTARIIKVKPLVTTDYWLKTSETISGITCKDSFMVRVRVNPLPVIKISAIDERCLNGSIISLNNFVKVNGNPTSLGIWTSPSMGLIYDDKFNPIAAGVSSPSGWKVRFEYTDPSTGCYNKDSGYVTIYPNPPTPVISLSPSDSFLECNLLNGSFKWYYTTDTFTTPTTINNNSYRIDPNLYCKNCYFNVIFTDTNGCVSNTSAFFYFAINSIDNTNRLSRLVFYPNPAHSELFIENRDNESASFTMTDIFGKTLLEKKIIPGKNAIPIQSFKPGVYFIFINRMIGGKLLIE